MANLLKLGDKAPEFTLQDMNDCELSLSKVESAYKVVYFYPKDNTPGCTIQAQQFSKDLKKLKDLNAEVIGISGGDSKSKALFCNKNKLSVTLLSDTDFEIAKKYGVFGEKFFMGRKYLGISRVTFLLDNNNQIIKVYEKASPEKNSSEIISVLKQLQGLAPAKNLMATSQVSAKVSKSATKKNTAKTTAKKKTVLKQSTVKKTAKKKLTKKKK
jgi:thioredoxin-dependent peroxiredoxin